jgi:undecaprenyl-diphosphatase
VMRTRALFSRVPGSTRLWLMLFVACALAFTFFEVVDDVFEDPLEGEVDTRAFDDSVTQLFVQFRSDAVTQVAVDLTALGSVSVLAVFAVLAYAAILVRRDWVGLAQLSVALLGALVWPSLLKDYFERERPDALMHLVTVGDLSFPSGHSFGAAACYATFAYFCARYLERKRDEVLCYALAVGIVVTVGITRIYLGVHYPTDVLAGASAGGAWAFFVAAAFSSWHRKNAASRAGSGSRDI